MGTRTSQIRTHVAVVGWLNILLNLPLAIVGLLVGLMGMPLLFVPVAGAFALVIAGLCVFALIASVAVLQYEQWGRIATIVLSLIGLFNVTTFGLSTAVAIYTLIILFLPATAELFERRGN
jgi:hypothetical protein